MPKAIQAQLKTLDEKDRASFQEKLRSERQVSDTTFRAMPETLDIPSRTVQLVATTNMPYLIRGWFMDFEEVLEISEEAIDLQRLSMGKMPLLKDHKNSVDAILGRVLSYNIVKAELRLDEMAPKSEYEKNLDELIVTVFIEEGDDGDKLLKRIESGTVRNVSIGYRVMDYDEYESPDRNNPDRIIVKRWELLEVSFVAVPADPHAGSRKLDNEPGRADNFNNSEKKDLNGEKKMPPEEKNSDESKKAAEEKAQKEAAEKAAKEAASEERERAAVAAQVAAETGLDHAKLIKDGTSILEIRKLGYEALLKKNTKVATAPITQGSSGVERKNKDFGDAFLSLLKTGKKYALEKDNQFRNMSLVQMMMKYHDAPWVSPAKFLREHFFSHRALGQGSFPQLIADELNRVLIDAYNERENPFAAISTTVIQSNLHAHKPTNFDIDGVPDEIGEGEDFPYAERSEEKHEIDIAKFGKMFSITEEAMLNDDLMAFNRIFMYLGRGMNLREAQLISSLLFGTQTYAGAAVFSAARRNLIAQAAATGGVNSTNVKAARVQMRKQQTPAGKPMDIFPGILNCGEDSAEDANAFLQSTIYPRLLGEETTSARRGIKNVITHPYIDNVLGDLSGKSFILAADPMDGGVEIVNRVIHRDHQMPEVYNDWNPRKSAMCYFSKYYLGIGLADFRGLVLSRGQ